MISAAKSRGLIEAGPDYRRGKRTGGISAEEDAASLKLEALRTTGQGWWDFRGEEPRPH